eukprot:CAMPEP_0175957978 /NCGR_PEP_ID=MMETSP0108-20121206/33991_1 /TAXON_ID=195067 ORGANISM="Goniomonas pacifica, Strain CCMP1869" /NCGR_SAMPLE_ID=MMETSP0108 /ASSEMBLY_ACC=CAM_ASM_000204 /LENGTH=62 /DNA_ID=CAMNT_0017285279 /DNA_START=49 /DNA_END=234 /DNA_ORIENTATION=-
MTLVLGAVPPPGRALCGPVPLHASMSCINVTFPSTPPTAATNVARFLACPVTSSSRASSNAP